MVRGGVCVCVWMGGAIPPPPIAGPPLWARCSSCSEYDLRIETARIIIAPWRCLPAKSAVFDSRDAVDSLGCGSRGSDPSPVSSADVSGRFACARSAWDGVRAQDFVGNATSRVDTDARGEKSKTKRQLPNGGRDFHTLCPDDVFGVSCSSFVWNSTCWHNANHVFFFYVGAMCTCLIVFVFH